MGGMPGDILDTIDNALEDFRTSGDAMRWRPEGSGEPEPPAAGWTALETFTARTPVSAAEWPAGSDVIPHGHLEVYPPAVSPAIAALREGDIVRFNGREWRVTRRVYEDGIYTFDLREPG